MNLTSIVVPASVTTVNQYVFKKRANLANAIFLSPSVKIDSFAFLQMPKDEKLFAKLY